MPARYGLIMAQSQSTHVVGSLNDIPLHDRAMPVDEFIGATTPPDHWLMPGPNVLTLQVPKGSVGPTTAIKATVWDGDTDTRLAEIEWPRDFSNGDPRMLLHGASPAHPVSVPFVMPDDHPRPFYMDAPVRDVPVNGDDEAWQPILAFHRGFVEGDRDAVAEGFALRAEVWDRAYDAKISKPGAVRQMVEDKVRGPYDMLPLDRDLTRFERIAGGRMLRVKRLDGLPLIAGKGRHEGAEPAVLPMPFLVFREGRYRIVF